MRDLTEEYGKEYPAAVIWNGIRMPLQRETDFTRGYYSEENNEGFMVSRFMDGSATITAVQLRRSWRFWSRDKKIDFCQSCSWLHEQEDFTEILRFIMTKGEPPEHSCIAGSIAARLPADEAFEMLRNSLGNTKPGKSCNIVQGIAVTKHPRAIALLHAHLAELQSAKGLWNDDKFVNWIAYDLICCIEYLIKLGAPAQDFEETVRQLSKHPCSGNQDSCRRFLSQHYTWLAEPE